MFTNLTNSTKAFLFFAIAFGLTVTVSLLAPLLGESTVFIHMFTPTLAAVIMMLVVTRDGATINGRLLNQDTFTLQLLDAQERLLLLEKSNLRESGVLKTSPMPPYRDKLSEQELADLVGYLASLRGRP
jgi:hypothetical protein